jgi:CheY-like chemotaxis protein
MIKPLALIVEDDPALSQIFSLALAGEFDTEAVTDGYAAQARLAKMVPAVVVLDLHIPGPSGASIIDLLHADARFAMTRTILSTADANEAERLRDQADIVLLKPVSPIQLRELASRLFKPS